MSTTRPGGVGEAGDGERPARVRVTAPRTTTARRRTPRTGTLEIDAQTEVGAIFVQSLLRAQLRVAAGVLGLLGVVVAGLPLVFWLFPDLAGRPLLGMPLAWGLLAFGVYPMIVALGYLFVRRAERNEAAFTDVVEGS